MTDPHVFAGNPLDRGERERRDEEWLSRKSKDPASKILPVCSSNVLLTDGDSPELAWLDWPDLERRGAEDNTLFLGLLNGTAYFVVDLSQQASVAEQIEATTSHRFEDTRTAGESLGVQDAGILAQARAQVNWHGRHGFCSVCGHETVIRRGGQKRECLSCKSEHFPRTDPVIIMVVSDGDRCLLGQSRGRLAAQNRYSALAGFVDHAESIEEAVAREVMEEAGIKVKNVRYHSSQPWPFPSSLMIGCHAEAATTDIKMDPEEMTDVRWFDREEVLLALEEKSELLRLPGRIAIAHHLIKAWANGQVN
ncbi:MAG: NAD(+) diphosphatase [Dehalococcoidia bacterium]